MPSEGIRGKVSGGKGREERGRGEETNSVNESRSEEREGSEEGKELDHREELKKKISWEVVRKWSEGGCCGERSRGRRTWFLMPRRCDQEGCDGKIS